MVFGESLLITSTGMGLYHITTMSFYDAEVKDLDSIVLEVMSCPHPAVIAPRPPMDRDLSFATSKFTLEGNVGTSAGPTTHGPPPVFRGALRAFSYPSKSTRSSRLGNNVNHNASFRERSEAYAASFRVPSAR